MTDSLFQRMGEMRMPTKASDVGAELTLAPLDPARDAMLALFAAACNAELGLAWAAVAAGTPLAGKSIVEDTWPGAPSPELVLQRRCDFPCLFLSRDGKGEYSDHSLALKQLKQTWGLHYIISPVDIGDFRKLGDILVRVGATIMATIERKGHPSYLSGAAVLYSAGLAVLNLSSVQAGQARFADGDKSAPLYHSLSCELESVEIAGSIPGTATDWRGTGYSISTGNADGLIQPMMQFDSETPLTMLQPWAVDAAISSDERLTTDADEVLVDDVGNVILNA